MPTDLPSGRRPPDFVLFVIASYSVGRRRVEQLKTTLLEKVQTPCDLVRLDTAGPDLLTALDNALLSGNYHHIRVQPLGTPMSDSLLNWLPGVLAYWRQDRASQIELTLGSDQVAHQSGWSAFLDASLAEPAQRITSDTEPALGKPGWSHVPEFRYHLLVCSGPRCQIHGAPPLLEQLRANCRRYGVINKSLISRTGCLFPCNQGPVVALYPQGAWYQLRDAGAVDDFIREVLVEGSQCLRHRIHQVTQLPPNPTKEVHIELTDITDPNGRFRAEPDAVRTESGERSA